MSRRSQMEILGLAVIVVLLILGFFLYFGLSKKPINNDRRDLANVKLSYRFVDVLLETNTQCSDATFSQLLLDSIKSIPTIDCAKDSETALRDISRQILDQSIKVRKKGYTFLVKRPGKPDFVLTHDDASGCSGKRTIHPSIYPLPSGVEIALTVCELS